MPMADKIRAQIANLEKDVRAAEEAEQKLRRQAMLGEGDIILHKPNSLSWVKRSMMQHAPTRNRSGNGRTPRS